MASKPTKARTQDAHPLVCLVGFMGAGKSTVGKLLAVSTGRRFFDLDEVVEARERAAVSKIFSRSGQAAFRNAETEALKDLLHQSRIESIVLAVGGGAFVQPENVAILRESAATTVFLSASAEELWQRCHNGANPENRPLLRDLAAFKHLYTERLRHYQKAAFQVDSSGKAPAALATEIVSLLGIASKKRA